MEFGVFLGAHNFLRERSERQLFADLAEQAALADQLGFDVVWLPEHHFNDYYLLADPFQLAVQILERTRRVRVGFGILILPNHHPLALAGKVAQLDVLYPGRIEVGVGRGSSGYEAQRFQNAMDLDTSRRYYLEHLRVMTTALSSDEDFSFEGEFFSFPSVTVLPRPLTRPTPPLWLAAVSPSSVYGQALNAGALGIEARVFQSPFRNPLSFVAESYVHLLKGLDEAGIPRSAARYAVNRTTFVSSNPDELEVMLARLKELHRGLYAQLEGTEQYRDGHTCIHPVDNELDTLSVVADNPIGDPSHVLEQVQGLIDIGVDQISSYFDLALPQELTLRSMRGFAEQVRPRLKL